MQLDTTVPVPKTIQFLCTQDYNHQQCVEDAKTLRQALTPYPLARLGAWSFVLVPADDWKALVRGQGGDPVSPAFSIPEQRVTILDRSDGRVPDGSKTPVRKLSKVTKIVAVATSTGTPQ